MNGNVHELDIAHEIEHEHELGSYSSRMNFLGLSATPLTRTS